jgi:hypothetical protein
VDDSTYQRITADFQVVNDEILEITVPQLSMECAQPTIIVQTADGVTMTLKKDMKCLKVKSYQEYDRFEVSKPAQIWMSPASRVSGVEMALIYVTDAAELSAIGRGRNCVFAKDGGRINMSLLKETVVYHEPFMFTGRRPEMSRDTGQNSGLKFVPTPAIRPSFVDVAFEFSK